MPRAIPITIDGVTYPSFRALERALREQREDALQELAYQRGFKHGQRNGTFEAGHALGWREALDLAIRVVEVRVFPRPTKFRVMEILIAEQKFGRPRTCAQTESVV